jgi:phosphatidylserine/phosphatidylglycerophosphate/cardiolipin synthase-like enzyme
MKKYLKSIIIILLFILFSISYAKEYFLFHSENKKEVINIEKTKEKVSNFSFDKIREIEKIELYRTPDKNLLKTLVEKIKNAKSRVYIEAYIFTEKEIRNAVIKAKKS